MALNRFRLRKFSLNFISCHRPRRSQPSTSSQAASASRAIAPGDDGYMRLAMDTIDELEWCLEQLETVQTHRSVSDMASLKVTSQSTAKLIKKLSPSPSLCAHTYIKKHFTMLELSSRMFGSHSIVD